jgi:hypothetical protein
VSTLKKKFVSIIRSVIMMLAVLIIGVSSTLTGVTAAHAATGNILPPFDEGQTWYICQGYDGTVSHTGTSQYGLDLTGSPNCGNGAAGRNARAPLAGTVAYWQAAFGNLCVNVAGGRSYTLTHINASVTSGNVVAGQVLGTVGAAGTLNNNGVAHIHFQLWSSPGCYNSPGVPFDSAHSARICGAPDLTVGGPGSNGQWSGTAFVGSSCSVTIKRFGVLGQDGVFSAKLGAYDNWLPQENNVVYAVMTGDRIGVIRTDGVLYVKEGNLYEGWTYLLDDAVAAYMSGYRIGVLQSDGDFWVKEGALNANWSLVAEDVVQAALGGTRIAVVGSDGLLRVKEGALNEGWTYQRGDAVSVSVSHNRVGVVVTNGDFVVKEGNLYQGWTIVENGVTSGVVTDNRIGVLKTDGLLKVKQGGLSEGWTNQEGNVASFTLSDTHVGVVFINGVYSLKEGTLYDGWLGMYANASKGFFITYTT